MMADNLTLDEFFSRVSESIPDVMGTLAGLIGIVPVTPEQKIVLLICVHELYPDGTDDWDWEPGYAAKLMDSLRNMASGRPADGISSAALDASVSSNLDLI